MHQEEKSIRDLLRRWLSGDSRRADERQLDRHAQKDPFLADALEGYRQEAEKDHSQRLEDLRARLHKRSQHRGAVPLWPRAAAAVFLLAVAGGIWWWAGHNGAGDSTATIAMKESPQSEADQIDDSSNAFVLSDSISTEVEPPSLTEALPPAESARPPQPISRPPQEKPAAAPDAGIALAEERDAPARALRVQPPAATSRLKEQRKISGQVSSENGDPLPDVVVAVPDRDLRTRTNEAGQYFLTIDSNVHRLTFNAPGFDQQIKLIGQADTLDVVLAFPLTEEQSDEAAMPKAQKAEAPAPEATPIGGFEELERYLRRNLRYPAAAREQGIEGTVRLQFTIRNDGKPSDFKILDSPSPAFDEESIRLLREGPRWELPAGSTENTRTYEIEFRLN